MELELLRLLVETRLENWRQSMSPNERVRLIIAVPSASRSIRVLIPLRDEHGRDFPTPAVVEAIASLVMDRMTFQIDKLRATRRSDQDGLEQWYVVVTCRTTIPDHRVRATLHIDAMHTNGAWALDAQ